MAAAPCDFVLWRRV